MSNLIAGTSPSLPTHGTQPLGGGFGVSACPLTPVPAGRSSIAHRGATTAGRGQEPCSLLLLQGRAAADPARAKRAQDQPVPGAGGVGLLPAVSPATGHGTASRVPPLPAATRGPSEAALHAVGVGSFARLTSWLLFARELLNEERVPSFFLDAMKSTIKRQRKKIRAKMLGTAEESASR